MKKFRVIDADVMPLIQIAYPPDAFQRIFIPEPASKRIT